MSAWHLNQDYEKIIDGEESSLESNKKRMLKYREDFADALDSLCENFYSSSFSKMVSSGDPEEDFKEMQDIINKGNWTLDVLRKLFDPRISEVIEQTFGQFIDKYGLDSQNGYMDFYLYRLNEKLDLNTTVWLGGHGWASFILESPEDEAVVKYAYGYHKTPYGKMCLEQIGLDKQQFVDLAYEYLKDYIKENVSGRVIRDLGKLLQLGFQVDTGQQWQKKFYNDLDLSDYVILDDDRFIINYTEMCDDFNQMTNNEFENAADPEWFKETILANMTSLFYNLDVQDTGNELIIND
jgi:hypothetical protein